MVQLARFPLLSDRNVAGLEILLNKRYTRFVAADVTHARKLSVEDHEVVAALLEIARRALPLPKNFDKLRELNEAFLKLAISRVHEETTLVAKHMLDRAVLDEGRFRVSRHGGMDEKELEFARMNDLENAPTTRLNMLSYNLFGTQGPKWGDERRLKELAVYGPDRLRTSVPHLTSPKDLRFEIFPFLKKDAGLADSMP